MSKDLIVKPLHAHGWRGDKIPAAELRREILNLYDLIGQVNESPAKSAVASMFKRLKLPS